jgi:hypothetical protein
MLFIIQALHDNKHQVHFLSFIDKTMHTSLVSGIHSFENVSGARVCFQYVVDL